MGNGTTGATANERGKQGHDIPRLVVDLVEAIEAIDFVTAGEAPSHNAARLERFARDLTREARPIAHRLVSLIRSDMGSNAEASRLRREAQRLCRDAHQYRRLARRLRHLG